MAHDDPSPPSRAGTTADDSRAAIPPSRPSRRSSNASTCSTTSITSLFESSLALLGSLPVATGSSSPSKPVIHHTSKFGPIKLYLSNVNTADEVRLQSHLVWPSSPWMAGLMEQGIVDVRGENVLELGAGSALLSLMAVKLGASSVLTTDYPAANILETIQKNADVNLGDSKEDLAKLDVCGLDWTDKEALQGLRRSYPDGFTRVLAADTLWLEDVNSDQIQVMAGLLSKTFHSRIWIVAGLHTGRHVIRRFLEMAIQIGFEIVQAQEVDRRGGENHSQFQAGEVGDKGIDWKRIIMAQRTGGRVEDKVEGIEEQEGSMYSGVEEDRRRWLLLAELKWRELSIQ